jgi:hypothetical protein
MNFTLALEFPISRLAALQESCQFEMRAFVKKNKNTDNKSFEEFA